MHFVIAGRINCSQFSYAVMVAQRLKENLPDFTYLKIPKQPDEWEKWLMKTCKENQWYHVQSPLIWREIGLKKGKKEFIGNINKFLDMCYDYYGIPRGVLAADDFNKTEMDWFRNRTESEFFDSIKEEAKDRRKFRSRQVCITGASAPITEIIVMELLQLEIQKREDGLEIRLFDESRKEAKLTSSANDAKYCPGPSGFGNCRVATTLKEALLNVDLVIVLDAFARKPKESLIKWLKRNRNAMCALGKALNLYAMVHCRVVIGSPSTQPNCYNANVLASFATKLHVRNIVVVTQDLGREMLKPLSTKTNVSLKDLYCPPVWGFVGLNKYVDVAKTLQTHIYKTPGKRKNSTLPQGTEEYEIRTVECLISEDDICDMHSKVGNFKNEAFPQLGRWPCLAKAAAIIDLLKLWSLKQEDGNGEIICLGVYSDGTFNIPEGLYWSQPVILKNGFWVPFPQYPIPRNYDVNCYYLFIFGLAALYRTRVKPRRYISPGKRVQSKVKKFDFDEIMKSVNMPVIKTDAECLNYIKNLAKKELGIDFDAVSYTFTEESEPEIVEAPETVRREELYCECWRQELKELQKVVYYRDSTTEVEVDLSENISGSEWSIVNSNRNDQRLSEEGLGSAINVPGGSGDGPSKIPNQLTTASSSGSTVCSCGALSNGSICRCLGEKKSCEGENLSTEHFYEEQNAQVFQDDLEDVIYADTYAPEKHVQFDPGADTGDRTSQLPRKFYGKKDAIRDEVAEMKMKKRIMRYERKSQESSEEGKYGEAEEMGEGESVEIESKESQIEQKYHIAIEGVPFDIIGDQDGFESLEMRRNEVESPSTKSFREMYVDEMSSPLRVIPPTLEKSETSSENYRSIQGEGFVELGSAYGEGSIVFADDDLRRRSLKSIEKALDAIYSDELVMEEGGEEFSGELGEIFDRYAEESDAASLSKKESTVGEKEKSEDEISKPPKIPKWKRQGIPICCLCRCIVPEGLPCCPCGSTTVMEVFKKESIEVFVQSEDDITYRVEYFQRFLPRESVSIISEKPLVTKKAKEKQVKELPPESFFPFSPKIPNEFQPTKRPKELTKEYLDTFKEPVEEELPPKCAELLNLARIKLEEEESQMESPDKERSMKATEESFDKCIPEDFPIKTNFSDLTLFTPEGIEDWRLTVQTKYREWFYEGPTIRDESYYDIAIEEVSEDEFDVDKDLEVYFED